MRNRRYRRRRYGNRWLLLGAAVVVLAVAALLLRLPRSAAPDAVPPQELLPADATPSDPVPEEPAAHRFPTPTNAMDEGWNVLLVNPWQPLPEGYADTIPLSTLSSGRQVDSRCLEPLEQMLSDCRAAGLEPLICSSFRTRATQQELFDSAVASRRANGLSEEEAYREAAKEVAVPDTSEHQVGLAVDIVDINHQLLDESQEHTPVQQWLMTHCADYGFILRYPNQKSSLTGIIYEPWHYRYVGKEIALDIMEQGVCLEEYLNS